PASVCPTSCSSACWRPGISMPACSWCVSSSSPCSISCCTWSTTRRRAHARWPCWEKYASRSPCCIRRRGSASRMASATSSRAVMRPVITATCGPSCSVPTRSANSRSTPERAAVSSTGRPVSASAGSFSPWAPAVPRWRASSPSVAVAPSRRRCCAATAWPDPAAPSRGRKKARRSGLFLFRGLSLATSGRLDFLGLQALLALGDDERDALTFLQGLEARALDRAKMHEQVITAFRRDEAKTLGVVEPLDCTALTIRHVTLPLKHGWFAAWSEMHLTARWASNPGCPGCSPAQHTPELAVPVAFRRKYLAPAQTGWPPAPGAAWPGHPLQWPHEDRLVER